MPVHIVDVPTGDAIDRARVRLLIREHGERQTADLLGLSRQTLARFVAGLPVQRGTIALLSLRLPGLTDGGAA